MIKFERTENCGPRRFYEAVIPWHELEEKLIVELSPCEIDYGKGGLGSHWRKRTDFDGSLTTFWHVTTYFYAVNGSCWGVYNPTVYHMPGRNVNRYEWFIEATDENVQVILNEVARMYEENIVHVEAPADYFERIA